MKKNFFAKIVGNNLILIITNASFSRLKFRICLKRACQRVELSIFTFATVFRAACRLQIVAFPILFDLIFKL